MSPSMCESSASSSSEETDSQVKTITNGVKHVVINGDGKSNGEQEKEKQRKRSSLSLV